MSRLLLAWVVFLTAPLTLTLLPPATHGQDDAVAGDDELVQKVKKSIDEGVSYLRSVQRKSDGSWEVGTSGLSGMGGWTALAIVALLNCGVKPEDEAIQRGLRYLRKITPNHTYIVSLQTMAFCLAKQPQDRAAIQRNVQWLVEARMPDGWTYHMPQAIATGQADNSNTQYALLGLHEAIQAGFKVDARTLKEVQTLYLRTQANGGWAYRPSSRSATMTMTTAGLCNLLIAGMDLARGQAVLRPDGSAENCGLYKDNEPIANALNWIGNRFPQRLTDENIYDRFVSPFYCLYGIERAGRLSGQRFFGGHDWYEVGCRYLVSAQRADGSWAGLQVRGSV